jgi:hypothetical protein
MDRRARSSLLAAVVLAVAGTVVTASLLLDREDASHVTAVDTSSEIEKTYSNDFLTSQRRAVAVAATSNKWPLVAISNAPDGTGLTVEATLESPRPQLEDDVRAVVSVPVAFKYGMGHPIPRPAFSPTM